MTYVGWVGGPRWVTVRGGSTAGQLAMPVDALVAQQAEAVDVARCVSVGGGQLSS